MIRRRFMIRTSRISPVKNGDDHRRISTALGIKSARAESWSNELDVDLVVAFVDKLVHEELADFCELDRVFTRLKLRLVDDRHEDLAPVRHRVVIRFFEIHER